jgi:hypothetical protein
MRMQSNFRGARAGCTLRRFKGRRCAAIVDLRHPPDKPEGTPEAPIVLQAILMP